MSFYHKLELSDFYFTAYHQRFTMKGPRDSSRGRKEPVEILRWVSLPDCTSGTARMIWVNPQARSTTSYLSREPLQGLCGRACFESLVSLLKGENHPSNFNDT